MQIGDMVRIRRRKMVGEAWEPPRYEEWWEAGGIVVKEYHTWEKIVTIVFKGEKMRLAANDVQLVSRPPPEDVNRVSRVKKLIDFESKV